MSTWLDPAPWWLVLAGWSVLVALWHTTALALAVAAWRAWRPQASARMQYAVTTGALVLALLLTLGTPVLLMVLRPQSGVAPSVRPAILSTSTSTPTAAVAAPLAPAPWASWRASATASARAAAPWLGAMWMAGAVAACIRLAAGCAVALWIRRRATAVTTAEIIDAAADASARWSLPPAPLLSSTHVDAPVVVGVRSPVILLPVDFERRLRAEALPPLLAHELAHVHRHDYAANVGQSFADALLWFSPGARWLSRAVRDAREYCCDDLVAAGCGAGPYATALTTLAGLGVATRARPAVNAAGPRLIVRIRRLLREDTVTSFNRLRLAGLCGSWTVAVAAGFAVVPASVAAVATGVSVAQGPAIDSAMTPITVSFIREHAGTAVVVEGIEPTAGGLCGVATIRNGTAVAIRTVRFEAEVIRGLGRSLSGGGERTIEIPPGATSRVAVNLLPATDALSGGGSGRADVTCHLWAIRFADGSSWFKTAEIRGGRDAATAVPRNVVTFTAPIKGPVPMGFIHTQSGLAVSLRDMTSSDAASCGVATLENRAHVAVTGIRFAAQAMAGGPEGSTLASVLSTSSPMLEVDVPPGASATVAANLVSLEDLRQTIRTGSPQVMCAVAEVRYANGTGWTAPPGAAFAPTQAEVARALIGGPPLPGTGVCRDQDGGEYSDGATVPIALEPGPTLARCQAGAWAEYRLPPARAAAR